MYTFSGTSAGQRDNSRLYVSAIEGGTVTSKCSLAILAAINYFEAGLLSFWFYELKFVFKEYY